MGLVRKPHAVLCEEKGIRTRGVMGTCISAIHVRRGVTCAASTNGQPRRRAELAIEIALPDIEMNTHWRMENPALRA